MAYVYNNNNNITEFSETNRPSDTTTYSTSSVDTLILDDNVIDSLTIDKSFGGNDDYIELHIVNNNNNIIHTEHNFVDYSFSSDSVTSNEIVLDPEKILTDRGFVTGKFKLKLNIFKNKIFNTSEKLPFLIKEISTDRRELRTIANDATNSTLDTAVNNFIADIQSSAYFKEYSLNFGNDQLIPAINIRLNKDPNKYEVLFRTLNPIPVSFTNRPFKVIEEISNPLYIEVDLGDPVYSSDYTLLREPNWQIDIRQNNSVPSGFKSYADLTYYNLTASFEELLSKLEPDSIELGIDYDYIRPVSTSSIEETYHFENFVHFGSAVGYLKNFKKKLELIESYDSQINKINSIPGATSTYQTSLTNKKNIHNKKLNIVKNFDGYEKYLYFSSGSFTWPKQNDSKPYILYSVSSSEAKNWLGDEKTYFGTYGGQLRSASLYDRQNPHNLNKLIPAHITDNLHNTTYVDFIDMIGKHFDGIWTYIKAITSIYDSNNIKGISKDLAYYQLKGVGIETFDQFENTSIMEYLLGVPSGSQKYATLHLSSSVSSETMITASNDSSMPKGDIAKEIWKRLYHNSSYLLKTKGTERGIRGLMSCYGIPPTILSIKEYGGSTPVAGPLKDTKTADHYKTFTYQKSGLALKGNSGTNGYFIKTKWGTSTNSLSISSSAKTVEFRIKPIRPTTNVQYDLIHMSSSTAANDYSLILTPYQGVDLYTTNDADTYAKIDLIKNGATIASTENFPAYNTEFWNVFIGTDGTSGSAADIKFGAYQSNFLKNIFYFTGSAALSEANRKVTFGDPYKDGVNNSGSDYVYFCGDPESSLGYEGSLQEIKIHYHQSASYEMLNHTTLKKHALEPYMYGGNHPSSSYNDVILRLPLGSNDLENSSSFHPNITTTYEEEFSSSMSTQEWEEVIEDHYLTTPDTIGISTTSEKVRIDTGTIEDDILSPIAKNETSTLDRQPQDFSDLGIYFSPTDELNEDIIYTLGSFRMDDYIGDPLPSAQSASFYKDLKDLHNYYFRKVEQKYDYWAYLKQIQYIDHTLFKLIEQFVPFRSNLKTGLVIEPHFLERNKIPREGWIERSDGQTMITGSHQTFEVDISSEYDENRIYQVVSSKASDFGGPKDLSDSEKNYAAAFLSSSGSPNAVQAIRVRGQWDPGSYISYHSNPHKFKTGSKGTAYRNEQGTNGTIPIYDEYLDPTDTDPNRENQQACQSPIKPYTGVRPSWPTYKAHESSVLLGNAIGGRLSNRYYKYNEYFMKSSSIY